MRVAFGNLGCKLNAAELEGFARAFAAAGHEVVARPEDADLHVVNTCTVTHVAARSSRRIGRRSGRLDGPRTVLTGCWVTERESEAAALPGIDLVVPNADKAQLLDRVSAAFPELVAPSTAPAAASAERWPAFGGSRALLAIEDGCNVGCTFCIIPSTRGRQRSRPADEVVAEARRLAGAGHAEIVLTGVQISHYRDHSTDLFALVRRLLAETTVPRLRLTSLAPWRFDRRLLGPISEGRVCRHVHLSLQSGSAATLARMGRPYAPGSYRALVDEIRAAVPRIAVTTDVIVGFPGETEEEFAETLAFVEACRFARIHVFPYSPREGTVAAGLADPVPAPVRSARAQRLREVAAESETAFRAAAVGELAEVVWNRERGDRWRGTTDHYLPVWSDSPLRLGGRLVPARLVAATDSGLEARIAPGAVAAGGWR